MNKFYDFNLDEVRKWLKDYFKFLDEGCTRLAALERIGISSNQLNRAMNLYCVKHKLFTDNGNMSIIKLKYSLRCAVKAEVKKGVGMAFNFIDDTDRDRRSSALSFSEQVRPLFINKEYEFEPEGNKYKGRRAIAVVKQMYAEMRERQVVKKGLEM